jgi:hypothetical protein
MSASGALFPVPQTLQRVGYDPFAKPSGKARFLRIAAVHCVVSALMQMRAARAGSMNCCICLASSGGALAADAPPLNLRNFHLRGTSPLIAE